MKNKRMNNSDGSTVTQGLAQQGILNRKKYVILINHKFPKINYYKKKELKLKYKIL